MKALKFFAVSVLMFLLSSCGNSVPLEKAAYVGLWQEKNMSLQISQGGSVQYKRSRNGVSTSINAPMKRFVGANFEVGLGPVVTTFIVSQPPLEDDGQWTMVVDGVKLIKVKD
jgi:hypothetical protein